MVDYLLIFILFALTIGILYLLFFTFSWWKNSKHDEDIDELDSDN
jgi:hypothetical protein